MATPHKTITQILVANASEANVYQTTHLGQDLNLLNTYTHAASRKKGSELVTDRPGRYQSRGNTSHGAFVEHTPPKEVEVEHFAHELAAELNKHYADYDYLIVIAPPHFHGLLNKYYTDTVRDKIAHNVEKNYTKLPQQQLQDFLRTLNRPKSAAA